MDAIRIEQDRGGETRNGGGRPNGARAEEITVAILDAALTEFLERGFHGASVAGIAARAGVTRVTVYKRFGGKDELFRQLSLHQARRLGDHLAEAIDFDRDVVGVLRDVGHSFWQSAESRAISRVLVMEAARRPGLAHQGFELRWRSLEPLTRYFERLAARGVIVTDDPARAAELFMHLTTGTFNFLFADEGEMDREAWILSGVRVFLHGVSPGSAANDRDPG